LETSPTRQQLKSMSWAKQTSLRVVQLPFRSLLNCPPSAMAFCRVMKHSFPVVRNFLDIKKTSSVSGQYLGLFWWDSLSVRWAVALCGSQFSHSNSAPSRCRKL
jgi:hypothetical protein